MTTESKLVYFFGRDEFNNDKNLTEGNMSMKQILGGKGANLAEMVNLGLSVPQGFTIATYACELYGSGENICEKCLKQYGVKINAQLVKEIESQLATLEKAVGKSFDGESNLLLVSVRSGAAASMPGMMDTILNVGLNDQRVQLFAKQTGNERLAYDSYRRLLQMFSDVVLRLEYSYFEDIIRETKAKRGIKFDSELTVDELKSIVDQYKKLIEKEYPSGFPQSPRHQLYMAIEAVLKSWNNSRAIEYRKMNNIQNLKGTAVNVQRMVFGNSNNQSGTGVAFSRNPSTGENKLWGEWLINAQGEDVVAGIRTPQEIQQLANEFPECYKQLASYAKQLEQRYKDVQDMEFTIQDNKLYMLQTRNGKTTTQAAVQIYVDMVTKENLLDKKSALMKIAPTNLNHLLHDQFDSSDKINHALIGKGLATSPGAAVGKIAFNSQQAIDMHAAGDSVILVRRDTEAEDLIGIAKAKGILTTTGGNTAHAAVVARGMGKTCVSGCQEALIDEKAETLTLGHKTFKKGDIISIDGSLGEIYAGALKTIRAEMTESFKLFMEWEKEFRKLGVRVNADTPLDVTTALEFGCEGIGLCRSEHMFFEPEKLKLMREVILAKNIEARKEALALLKPFQRKDYYEMFKAIKSKPFTLRLLDPPLHEFLPVADNKAGIAAVAKDLNISEADVTQRAIELKEVNPMIGKRGCRVGILFPEITQMQAEAFFEAAVQAAEELNMTVRPEVMVPLISSVNELIHQKAIVEAAAKSIIPKSKIPIKYMIGCMIETPRAALTADKIAPVAQFFSFGTNDLTQTTFAFSRDDVSKFLPKYLNEKIIPYDPFQVLDEDGVGALIGIAVQKGRAQNKDLEIGLCGEIGGEPESIRTLTKIGGLDYTSVSPYRVLIARLAACQAAIELSK